jgi:hypothetical protein
MRMTPFETYKTYLALKQHFTLDNYDYFKYNGKVRASENSFNNRKDRFFFSKLSRALSDDEIVELFVSNFLESDKTWIKDMFSDEAKSRFRRYQKTLQSLSYTFKEEFVKVRDFMDQHNLEFDDLFEVRSNEHPHIIKLHLEGVVSLQSLVIANKVLNFMPRLDRLLDEPYIYGPLSVRVKKYTPFLSIVDETKYKKILIEIFT